MKRVRIEVPGWASADERPSVLLVSEDADFRAVAGRVLAAADYAAETAAHAGHALLACMRQPFNIILVDESSIHDARGLVSTLVKHAPHAAVSPMRQRPASAGDLLALVASVTPQA